MIKKVISLNKLLTSLERFNIPHQINTKVKHQTLAEEICGPVLNKSASKVYIHKKNSNFVIKEIFKHKNDRKGAFSASVQKEAVIQAWINHIYPDDTPKIKALIKTDEGYFIIMERIYGKDILDYIVEKPNPLEKKLTLCLKVAEKIRNIHKLDIVHRDLRLMNVMIKEDEQTVCLIDFGLATLHDLKFRFHRELLLGPSDYTPDEDYLRTDEYQIVKKSVDLYCLGVLMFEILANEKYGEKEKYHRKLISIKNNNNKKIKKGIEKRLKEIKPAQKPNELKEIIELLCELMHHNPEKRKSAEWAINKIKTILVKHHGWRY